MSGISLNDLTSNVALLPLTEVQWSRDGTQFFNIEVDTVNYKTGNASVLVGTKSNSYLTFASPINFYNVAQMSGITFSLWFRMSTSSGTNANLFCFSDSTGNTPSGNYIYVSRNGAGNTLNFQINSGSANTGTYLCVDNQWHHLVWSIAKNGIWTVYIDNKNMNISTVFSVPNTNNWTYQYVGKSAFTNFGTTICNYNDVRVYSRVTTATEVDLIYNAANVNNLVSVGGTIGIGTTTPSSNICKLDVAGTINCSNLFVNGNVIKDDSWIKTANNILYTSSNLGIGTRSGGNNSNKLEVYGGDIYTSNGNMQKYAGEKVSDPVVWYQFNQDPTNGSVILSDSNPTTSKINMTLQDYNDVYNLTNYMVAWYQFKSSTNLLLDSSGANISLLKVNTVLYPTAQLSNPIFKHLTSTDAAYFYNNNSYLYVNNYNNSGTYGYFTSDTFTVSCFYYFVPITTIGAIQAIASCMTGDSTTGTLRGWQIQVKTTYAGIYTYTLQFVTTVSTTTTLLVTKNITTIPSTGWIHTVFCCSPNLNGTDYDLYYEITNISYGNIVSGTILTAYEPSNGVNSYLRIGAGRINVTANNGNPTNYVANGTYISDFRFYSIVLDANEIKQIFGQSIIKRTVALSNQYIYTNQYILYANTKSPTFLAYYGDITLQSLLNKLHNNGFSIHFVLYIIGYDYDTNAKQSDIIFIGNNRTYASLIRAYIIKTYDNVNNIIITTLYFSVGSNVVSTIISLNRYYTIDLICTISGLTMNLYLNIYDINANSTSKSNVLNQSYSNFLLNASMTDLVFYLGKHPNSNITSFETIMLQDFRLYTSILSDYAITSLQTGQVSIMNYSINDRYQLQRWTDSPNYYSASPKYIAYTGGNIGVGIADPGSYKLSISSNLFITGNLISSSNMYAYGSVSDERLKTIVKNIDDKNALDIVNSLSVFKYKTDNEIAYSFGLNSDRVYVGLSAQEVQRGFKEAVFIAPFDAVEGSDGTIVSKSGNNYLAIYYKRMIPVLVAAFKELLRKYTETTERINRLKASS